MAKKYKWRLLLDMDGPMASFDIHFWNLAHERGHSFEIESVDHQTARYITDHIHKDRRTEARALTYETGFFRAFPVVPGAQEGVEKLIEYGVDVWVCTKPLERNPTVRDEKYAWIAEHFPALDHKLIIAPDKSLIRGDILLDDAIKLEWIPKAEWQPVVFNYSWNGDGSEWEKLPHWDWSKDVAELNELIDRHRAQGRYIDLYETAKPVNFSTNTIISWSDF